MQQDMRFSEILKEATGIDLMDMQEKKMKSDEMQADAKKKREEEDKKKKEEDEKKKKEAEEAALPEEERLKVQTQKEAEALKAQGNDFYKKKDFENALKLYQQAIDKNPDEITYYTNKAAVYFEMKNFEECIKWCDNGIEAIQGKAYDYVKLAKALARKANAQLQLKLYDESIATYQKALLEDQSHVIKMALQKAKQVKKEAEAKAYIDPEKAEEHRQKGNELFKEGNFPGAIKEYDEGLRRDPSSVAIYSNRCATYIKLMVMDQALKDAEKCIELDPKFVKAYLRKGNCHHLMKEYHKAMKAYDDGLKLEPDNAEIKQAQQKTMMAIQMGATSGGDHDNQRAEQAMKDPEI